MASSKTDLCNLALGHLGATPPFLINVDTDLSKEALLCNQHIDSTRRALLRSFIWNFAKDRVTLTLPTITGAANNGADLIRITKATHGFSTGNRISLSEVTGTSEANGTWTITVFDANNFDLIGSTFTNTYVSGGYVSLAPAFEYIHKHAIPTDMLRLVNLETPRADVVDRKLESVFIITDDPVLELIYIKDVSNYTLMDAAFYESLSLRLAIAICYAITQSNKLRQELQDMFLDSIRKARFVDSIEDPMLKVEANEWILSRDGLNDGFVRDPGT